MDPKDFNGPKWRSHDSSILSKVRKLRKDATPAERILWEQLRNKKCLGFKFRRQHPIYLEIRNRIKSYVIADFCCVQRKLIIEVDGDYHLQDDQWLKDILRTREVMRLGYRVIRFRNEEVERNLSDVMKMIRKCLRSI